MDSALLDDPNDMRVTFSKWLGESKKVFWIKSIAATRSELGTQWRPTCYYERSGLNINLNQFIWPTF